MRLLAIQRRCHEWSKCRAGLRRRRLLWMRMPMTDQVSFDNRTGPGGGGGEF